MQARTSKTDHGKRSTMGAGAVAIKDVKANGIAVGSREVLKAYRRAARSLLYSGSAWMLG